MLVVSFLVETYVLVCVWVWMWVCIHTLYPSALLLCPPVLSCHLHLASSLFCVERRATSGYWMANWRATRTGCGTWHGPPALGCQSAGLPAARKTAASSCGGRTRLRGGHGHLR